MTGCPKTDAVRPLVIDDHVHPSRQPRSVTLCIALGHPDLSVMFLELGERHALWTRAARQKQGEEKGV